MLHAGAWITTAIRDISYQWYNSHHHRYQRHDNIATRYLSFTDQSLRGQEWHPPYRAKRQTAIIHRNVTRHRFFIYISEFHDSITSLGKGIPLHLSSINNTYYQALFYLIGFIYVASTYLRNNRLGLLPVVIKVDIMWKICNNCQL